MAAKDKPEKGDKNAGRSAPKSSKASAGPAPSFGLVLVRVATGALLLVEGARRIELGVDPDFVTRTAPAWAAAPESVAWWGENVVLEHASLAAHVVAWGEVVLGALLFLGLLTRPAGIFAAFLFANAAFALDGSQQALAALLTICCLACALSRAGRSAGADVFVDGRLPRWMTWARG